MPNSRQYNRVPNRIPQAAMQHHPGLKGRKERRMGEGRSRGGLPTEQLVHRVQRDREDHKG